MLRLVGQNSVISAVPNVLSDGSQYDTNEIIRRFDIDDYVWATVNLYLDIINLFLRLMEILQRAQRN